MTAEPTTGTVLFLLGTSTGIVSGIFGVGAGLLIVAALLLLNIFCSSSLSMPNYQFKYLKSVLFLDLCLCRPN
jgi:uncharacterized membrane protein YfcA